MKKTMLVISLIAIFALSAVACSSQDGTGSNDPEATATATQAADMGNAADPATSGNDDNAANNNGNDNTANNDNMQSSGNGGASLDGIQQEAEQIQQDAQELESDLTGSGA